MVPNPAARPRRSSPRDGAFPRRPSRLAERVAAALVDEGLLPAGERDRAARVATRVLTAQPIEAGPLRRRLAEVAGYIGSGFLIAAATLLVADYWDQMGSVVRVAILVGVAALLAVVGSAVAWLGGRRGEGLPLTPVRQRLASVLWTGAAVASGAAVGIGLSELGHPPGPDWLVAVAVGVTVTVISAAGYLISPTALGQVGIGAGVAWLVPSVLAAFHQDRPLTIGLGFVLVACAWLVVSELGLWREHDVGLVLAVVGLMGGAQLPMGSTHEWVAYGLTLVVAASGFIAYVLRRSWPYLVLGIAGVTIGVPEALMDLTQGSLGAAGVLLVAGATLLVASLLGLRLRRVDLAGGGPH